MSEVNAGRSLYARLRPLAKEVRALASHTQALVGRATDVDSMEDWEALSESCVFLAFKSLQRQLGKRKILLDITRRDHQRRVVAEARRLFSNELQGKGSNFLDWRMREGGTAGERRERSQVDPRCWDAWQRMNPEVAQERDLQAGVAGDLLADLAKVLNPTELHLLQAHYFEGKSQRELAQELVRTDPRYRLHPRSALQRAEGRINVILCRARKLAREQLAAKWQVQAREAVCCSD